MQDVHGVLAVLAGGVDVAADVEAVLGDVVAGQAAGDLLLGLERADAALADVARRPDARVRREPQDVAAALFAGFERLAAGFLVRAVLRARDAGHPRKPGEDSVPEFVFQRLGRVLGDSGKSRSQAACQAWIMPRSARCACTGQTASGYKWSRSRLNQSGGSRSRVSKFVVVNHGRGAMTTRPGRSPMKPAHQLNELFAITNPSTWERMRITSNG